MFMRKLSTLVECQNIKFRFFYDSRSRFDTIFAPSTAIQPIQGSPLGVIRVSGIQSRQVIQQLTGCNSINQDLNRRYPTIKPREAKLVKFVVPSTGELIDSGLVIWFPKPRSYTGEDVCEFHLHGSQAVMSKMLTLLGSITGLRPAEPGEFTRRAVFNGKTTLLQAESLPDLIASQTDNQRKLALKGLDGSTRHKYEIWIRSLIDILGHLEASIDFGEDELIDEKRVVGNCMIKLQSILEEVLNFIESSGRCRAFIRYGFKVVLLGKPNAGKSTLMNLLCRSNKSIVSELSGTTRDVIEHLIELGGHCLTLCDTAGLVNLNTVSSLSESSSTPLLQQHEKIEREGIRRALETAVNADLILYVVDASELSDGGTELVDKISELQETLHLIEGERDKKVVHLVINKIDLNNGLLTDDVRRNLERCLKENEVDTNFISCTTQENFHNFIDQLAERLNALICDQDTSSRLQSKTKNKDFSTLDFVNERHLSLLKTTVEHLQQASRLNMTTIDQMAQHVRESVDYLSRIVGSVTNEQVIDVIFRDFCIGK